MAISTITIGANDYTAYASVAEADIYLAVDPVRSATWAALTTDQKGQYLVAATRRLDLLTWSGTKTGDEGTQINAWPRTGVTYADGTAVSTSEVPQEVEDATILLAGTIASTPTASGAGDSSSNNKRVKAGSAEVEFFAPTTGKPLQDETAYALLEQFLGTNSIVVGSTFGTTDANGDSVTSTFECDDLGRGTQGYN